MSPRLRKHKVKQVDEGTWNIRLNDHVLIEWERDIEGQSIHAKYNVSILTSVGPETLMYYVVGHSNQPTSHWILHDIELVIGAFDHDKEIVMEEYENIDVPCQYVASLHTWLKMAKERGAFA
jgi:hypothetical protein